MQVSAKKNAQHEICELNFLMGPNQDYSQGDNLSDSSEELLQKGRGEVSIHMILVKSIREIKHIFWQKVTASHEEQTSWLIIFSRYEELQETGLIKFSESI